MAVIRCHMLSNFLSGFLRMLSKTWVIFSLQYWWTHSRSWHVHLLLVCHLLIKSITLNKARQASVLAVALQRLCPASKCFRDSTPSWTRRLCDPCWLGTSTIHACTDSLSHGHRDVTYLLILPSFHHSFVLVDLSSWLGCCKSMWSHFTLSLYY